MEVEARRIQRSMRLDPRAGLLHMLVRHGGECTILHVIFDHSKLNGLNIMHLLGKRSKEVMAALFQWKRSYFRLHKHVFIYKRSLQVARSALNSLQSVLCVHIFQAPYPMMRAQNIYKEIFRLFASDFFICIDVSHLFSGEPCLLRISFYWDRDFDEQWHEMLALKKSKDLVISTWQQHLRKQSRWASHLPQTCPEFLPIYGDTSPLKTSDVTSISAVAFSLAMDCSGCFFSIYPSAEDPEDVEMQHRFRDFRNLFGLEASHLRVRPAEDVSALAYSKLDASGKPEFARL